MGLAKSDGQSTSWMASVSVAMVKAMFSWNVSVRPHLISDSSFSWCRTVSPFIVHGLIPKAGQENGCQCLVNAGSKKSHGKPKHPSGGVVLGMISQAWWGRSSISIGKVIMENVTELELQALKAIFKNSDGGDGRTLDALENDNCSWFNTSDLAENCDWSLDRAKGVISSLLSKRLNIFSFIFDTAPAE